MKNLFVMHTQYNLILSAAILTRVPGDHNTLVLFAEFQVTEEMRLTLESIFDRVFVVNDNYVPPMTPFREACFVRKCLKKVKCLKSERFDRLYMSQERIFDMILCARVKKNNSNALCQAVEEDVYYSINNTYNAPDYVPTVSFRLKLRKLRYAIYLLGYPYNYRDVHYFYGMSSEYQGVNMLFPQIARRELAQKERLEITKDELLHGIKSIYEQRETNFPTSEKYMVMFFDLLNRYHSPDFVKNLVKTVVAECQAQNRTLLIKYHPRETEKFTQLGSIFEIDKLIPAEKVLYDLRDKDVVVFGNATTSCIVAAKLNFHVISICKLEFPNHNRIHEAMEKMGITCINTIDQIKKYI